VPGISSNPRISGSSAGLTSLGAVGGPRGTAAAGARILVEFVTTYDAGAVKQLQADLAQFTNVIATEEAKRTRIVQQNINARNRFERGNIIASAKIAAAGERGADTRQLRKDLAEARDLARSPHLVDRREAKQRMDDFIAGLNQVGVLTARDEQTLRRMLTARNTQLRTAKQLEASAKKQHEATKGQAAAQSKLLALQKAGALAQKFGALAIGAAGGLVGGLVIGALFTALEAVLGQMGEAVLSLIDPLRQAKAEFKALGEEIRAISGDNIFTDADRVEAWAKQYGLSLTEAEKRTLAYAAAVDRYVESETKRRQAEEAAKGGTGALDEQIKKLRNELIKADKDSGNLVTKYGQVGMASGQVADQEYYLKLATEQTTAAMLAQTTALYAQAVAARNSAQATAYAAIAQQEFESAATRAMGRQSAGYDARIAALGSGESARTRGLQAQLDKAQGGGGSNAKALAENAEERALTLLRQRLRLLGTAINIEKYSGKFQLEAINMRIQALQEEGDAQDRVNRLLDNQYKQSQEVKRNQGETISDYLERRAQQNRELLAEADQLNRDEQTAQLEKRKAVVEDEIKLEELAQQRREILMAAGTSAYVKELQKRLEASKAADEKALEAKKKALEAEKAANEKAAQDAIKLSTDEETKKGLLAIAGMHNVEQLGRISGWMAGLVRARSALEALVKGFGIPAGLAAPYLANLDSQIAAWDAKAIALTGALETKSGKTRLASGGVVMLRNSQNPFGSNVQVGEEGNELAVVLSNKVTNALMRSKNNGGNNIGPFFLQSTNDPLRDQFTFRRLVSEAVGEALR
jgi:hypothetical protein